MRAARAARLILRVQSIKILINFVSLSIAETSLMLELQYSCTAQRFFLSPVFIFHLSPSVDQAGKELGIACSQEPYFMISEDKMDQEQKFLRMLQFKVK